MPRIKPIEYDKAAPAAHAEWDRQVAKHGRMTNMKRTLAHSPAALLALMQWYDLREEVAAFLGERLTTIFSHAISAQTDCLICSTFFRRALIESGEDPDKLKLDEREQTVVEFGRQLVNDPNNVSDGQFSKLAKIFNPPQIIALTAFGAMMIATNVVNNALKVDLDEYLFPFQKGFQEKTKGKRK